MKKSILLIFVPLISFFSLSAQITQISADSIVQKCMTDETRMFSIYAQINVQTAFEISTSSGEIVELDYPCWIYYVHFNEESNGKYLIVKETNGNLLEINVKNNEVPANLAEWRIVPFIISKCQETRNLCPSNDSILVEYVGKYLHITHLNAYFICDFEEIIISMLFDGYTIEVTERAWPQLTNCVCCVDFSYSVGAFESGTYLLIIKLRSREVYNQIIEIP